MEVEAAQPRGEDKPREGGGGGGGGRDGKTRRNNNRSRRNDKGVGGEKSARTKPKKGGPAAKGTPAAGATGEFCQKEGGCCSRWPSQPKDWSEAGGASRGEGGGMSLLSSTAIESPLAFFRLAADSCAPCGPHSCSRSAPVGVSLLMA